MAPNKIHLLQKYLQLENVYVLGIQEMARNPITLHNNNMHKNNLVNNDRTVGIAVRMDCLIHNVFHHPTGRIIMVAIFTLGVPTFPIDTNTEKPVLTSCTMTAVF